MKKLHKNKTFAAFLATVAGSIGLHRFYLYGQRDVWGWLHLASLPLSGAAMALWPTAPLLFSVGPLILSGLIAVIEALVLGVTPDERWDAQYNPASSRTSESNWPLAVVLVLAAGIGATVLIAVIARSFDLLFTGGTYG